MDPVKAAQPAGESEVSSSWPNGDLLSLPLIHQESAMADLAFVATTTAIFALVALVARGVTKP
ncbi:hypothetical protein [Streptomyces sp. NRRL F-5702]|uniref:hypothetical protein n=1 Tax=Streptomyces sp. NRRL F-5702 TaxID=1463870 RepID=UPI00131BE400|nr:hypothetical protein [Streptomyces sp. NRRL F-5702]